MTNYKKDGEYLIIIDNILKNNEFKKMSDIKHHNTTRMDHSLKVSYYSYKIAKALNVPLIPLQSILKKIIQISF